MNANHPALRRMELMHGILHLAVALARGALYVPPGTNLKARSPTVVHDTSQNLL